MNSKICPKPRVTWQFLPLLGKYLLMACIGLGCVLPIKANAENAQLCQKDNDCFAGYACVSQECKVVLDLWHSYIGAEKDTLEKVVQDFRTLNPEIEVKVLAVPNSSIANKVVSAVPNGNGPDLVIDAHDKIGNWADIKIIRDVSPYVSLVEWDSFHSVTVDAMKYTRKDNDGSSHSGIYAIPIAYKSLVLFYNSDTVKEPPKTTSELYAYMQSHTVQNCSSEDTSCKVHYGLAYENTDLFRHSLWLNGFGGSLFDESGNIQVNNPNTVKSIEFARKLSKLIPGGVDSARIQTLFSEGTVDMVINGSWFMGELSPQTVENRQDKSKFHYGVAVLPRIDEPGAPAEAWSKPFLTAEGIYMAYDTRASLALKKLERDVPGSEEYKRAQVLEEARRLSAAKLMKFIAIDGAYKRMTLGSQMVSYKAAYTQLAQDTSDATSFIRMVAPVFLAQLDHSVPQSNRPEMGSIWDSMRKALQKAFYGGASGETPYLLFLFLSLIVCGFLFLSKATNPSVVTAQRHKLHVSVTIASFLASIPVFIWLYKVQGNKKDLDVGFLLNEAQNRITTLKPPPAVETNPGPYILALCLILGILCVLGVFAYRRHKSKNIEYTDNKVALAFVSPAVIGMIVLVFLPFIVGAFLSFFTYQNGDYIFVGLQNFKRLFFSDQASFLDSMSIYFTFVVTVLWTILNVALHVGIGMALALLLREPWLRLKGIYRVLLIVPWAIPNYITALVWRGMFDHNFGAINQLLVGMGLDRVEWFNEFLTSFAANLTTNTWLGFPFMMVVTLGALQAIPRDLEDAASVDGASAWQRFRHVTFPLLKPALMPSVILGSIWTFNAFNIIYLVSKGDPDGSTEILVSEAYKWAFERQYQYGYAAAYAMVVFVILILYSKLTQYILEDKKA